MSRDFRSEVQIALDDAAHLLLTVGELLTEHGGHLQLLEQGISVHFTDSQAFFDWSATAASIHLQAGSREALLLLRSEVSEHLRECLGNAQLALRWQGEPLTAVVLPDFRLLTVVSNQPLTAHMRRLVLQGDIDRYDTLEALHVKLLFESNGQPCTRIPLLQENGQVQWGEAGERPQARKYTLRSLDVVNGLVTIDFVIHADAGPGSAFAAAATPGQQIGVIGTGGGGLIEARRYLFMGDETALPAIARMLEHLPDTAQARVFIEVADEAEQQPLESPGHAEVQWFYRDGCPAGSSNLLIDALRGVHLEKDGATYIWVGCEHRVFRLIRAHVRGYRLPKGSHLIVGYWRQGQADA